MVIKTENIPHDGGFLLSEAPGTYSREAVTVLSGQNLRAGAVLGAVALGAAVAAAAAGNTGGSGAMSAVVVGAGAKVGVYNVVCIEPASNAGKFLVMDPFGVLVGVATVAVEFVGGGLTFTIADATDFVAGDRFTITVAAGTGKVRALDTAGTTGTAVASGILFGDVDASAADQPGAAIVRGPCEVNSSLLVWPTGISDNNKALAVAALAALGILVRTAAATYQVGAEA